MAVTLFAHQETALALLRINDGFSLWMEQGTGKTYPVLFRLAELAAAGSIASAIVVCPKTVRGGWLDKAARLDDGQRAALDSIRFEVVSYDMVWRREEYSEGAFDAVVLDEAHYIKNPAAKRTKACLGLCARARYRWCLTGTPVSNGALCDVWSQLAAVDPDPVEGRDGRARVYPRCLGSLPYSKWIRRVAVMDQWHKPKTYLKVAEIQRAMGEWGWRVRKEDCLDLPEKMPDELLRVQLPQKAAADYRSMARTGAVLRLETLAQNPLTRSLRLRQICSGFMDTDDGMREEYPDAKLPALLELAEGVEGKLVVFCNFTRSIDAVSRALSSAGRPCLTLDGRSKGDEWLRFQEDPKWRAIAVQYQAGSTGIDLYAADTMVFYEPTLSSNLLEQARDRIHRTGQKRACSYYFLLAEGTVEEAVYAALAQYRDFSEEMFERYIETYTKGGGWE